MHDRIISLRALEPKQAGQNSYRAILESASGLFSQFPAVDVALRDIIGTAGVANQTLYNYFPAGRDDIALVLKDRYDLDVLHSFERLLESAAWAEGSGATQAAALLGASLVGAVFGRVHQDPFFAASLHGYLETRALATIAAGREDLREALRREAQDRCPGWFTREELPRITHLCVHHAQEMARISMEHPEYPLDRMESNARLIVRSLLQTAVQEWTTSSAGFKARPSAAAPSAVPPARISEQKRVSILNRILKRKQQS